MTLRRAELLLSIYGALGIAMALVAFTNRATLDSEIDHNLGNGVADYVLLGGFLAGVALMIVISRSMNRMQTAQWFGYLVPAAAFLLGWRGWLGLAGGIALSISFAALLHEGFRRPDRLIRVGVPATAVIDEVVRPWFNVTINNVYLMRTLRLTIRRDDGVAPYKTKRREMFMIGDLPDAGDTFRIRVDPKHPKRLESQRTLDALFPKSLVKDGGTDGGTDDADRGDGRGRSSAGRSTSAVLSTGSIAGQLDQLAQLHAQGILDDEQYAAAKRKVFRHDAPS